VALSPAASFPASPLSLWPSRGRTKHERWREERLSPDVIFPAKNLEQSFRDVLLATRVPSPVAEVAAVGTVVTASADPLAPRGSTNAARPAPHCFSKESEEELITDGMVVTAPADPPAPCGPLFATSRRVAAVVGTTLFVSADASAPRSQATTPRREDALAQSDDGWQKVESRKSRHRRLKEARPRRLVPADLTGKCFNCFSMKHFAAQCFQRTRCFRCCAQGHRAFRSPNVHDGRELGPLQKPKLVDKMRRLTTGGMVWRKKIASVPPVASTATGSEPATGKMEEAGRENAKPQRRRPHKRRPSSHVSQEHPQQPTSSMSVESAVLLPRHAAKDFPPCVLNWSNQMTRAEEDLINTVVVSVISDCSNVTDGEVANLIAPLLEVTADSLVLRQNSPVSFLLMLPSVEMAVRLAKQRPLLRAAFFSIVYKRWSRMMGSTGGVLPDLVELELRGIPSHAWEVSTVELLLNPFA
jgi:hypothetical protein